MEEQLIVGAVVVVVVVEMSAGDGQPFLLHLTTEAELSASAADSSCLRYPESEKNRVTAFSTYKDET